MLCRANHSHSFFPPQLQCFFDDSALTHARAHSHMHSHTLSFSRQRRMKHSACPYWLSESQLLVETQRGLYASDVDVHRLICTEVRERRVAPACPSLDPPLPSPPFPSLPLPSPPLPNHTHTLSPTSPWLALCSFSPSAFVLCRIFFARRGQHRLLRGLPAIDDEWSVTGMAPDGSALVMSTPSQSFVSPFVQQQQQQQQQHGIRLSTWPTWWL